MGYTVKQLIARFRSDMDDTVETYLWSDNEIRDYLDQAQIEFTEQVDAISDEVEIDYGAEELWAEYPEYITRTRDAYIQRDTGTTADIDVVSYSTWNDNPPANWRSVQGSEPKTFITDLKTGYVRVYPIPLLGGVAILNVYRNPKTRVSNKQELEVTDPQQQLAILIGARSFAYLKQDSETYNKDSANELRTRFEELMEQHKHRIKRKTRPAGNVAYGGID